MGFQKGNTWGRLTKGKHPKSLSPEHREKISLALKGKMPKNLVAINANKFGEGNPMYGVKDTPERTEQRRKVMQEYWNKNLARKDKLRERFSGEGNPRWGADMREDKSPTWRGEDVGYHGVHKWVARWKGTPRVCEKCGTTTAKKYEWANIDHTYRRVLDEYIRLCTRCHRKHDNENN